MPYSTAHPPVTLHLGAHRTGCAALQAMLAAAPLVEEGIAVWTPSRLRGGLLAGVTDTRGPHDDVAAHRSAGRISLLRDGLARAGATRLIVSDADLLGRPREALAEGRLYPSAGARLARLRDALPGIDRICLALCPPGAWWRDALAHRQTLGMPAPAPSVLAGLAGAARTWRDVIADLAAQLPDANIHVWEGARTETGAAFGIVADDAMPAPAGLPVTALDDFGPADPFTASQHAVLDDGYAADLDWLRGGADGLARDMTEWPARAVGNDGKGWHHGGRPEGQMGAAG